MSEQTTAPKSAKKKKSGGKAAAKSEAKVAKTAAAEAPKAESPASIHALQGPARTWTAAPPRRSATVRASATSR